MAETEADFDHTEGSAEEHASRSESLLKEGHHEDAVLEAEMALDGLPFMARAALTRGRGLLYPALAKRDAGGPPPDQAVLHEAGRAFMLAQFLDSGCEEAEDEMEKLQKLKGGVSDKPKKPLGDRSAQPPAPCDLCALRPLATAAPHAASRAASRATSRARRAPAACSPVRTRCRVRGRPREGGGASARL